ncbi:MAG: CPBP family intramembrane metalloprotease [Spirochaetales bacterium]|nr:CPBP family intramembrane metalloprotease [Spirochaetales bacterium]
MKKTILKRLFLWSPSTNTGMAAFSVVLMMILAYLVSLIFFGKTWLSFIIFNLLGTIGVCVILPLYWMVVVRKKGLNTLGITRRHWIVSLIAGVFLAGFTLWGYYRSFGISTAVIPALIVGIYALWEVVFVYGWLQLRFEEAFGIIPAAILAGLCFSLYHLGYGLYDLFGLAVLFIFGLIFAIVFRFTKNILILWPFLWPVACLRGFKMGGVSPDWGDAGFSAVLLVLMLISIVIFYRIEKTRLFLKNNDLTSPIRRRKNKNDR